MLIARNGRTPRVAASARVASSACIVGDLSRIGVAAIVHAKTVLPDRTRVGMRHIAVPRVGGFIETADVEVARQAVREAGFFETAFGLEETDQETVHERVITTLLEEVHAWRDERVELVD